MNHTLAKTLTGLGVALACACGCKSPGPGFDPRAESAYRISGGFTNAFDGELTDAALLNPPPDLFTLGPGDVIEIENLEELGNATTVLVGPDGRIYYGLLPGLDVWGLTLAETKQRLEEGLARYIRADIDLTVTLRAVGSKRVWMLGVVATPGVYSLGTPMTLLEALSRAGGVPTLGAGTEEMADLSRSFVLREGETLPVDMGRLLRQGDMSQNVYLRSDDFIYIKPADAWNVYILGAVPGPGALPYTGQMTLMSAIGGAGGTLPNAHETHVAVVRGSIQAPRIAVVDFQSLLRGEATDFLLEPGDIVYVPYSPYRKLNDFAKEIMNTFVRSVAINAGARSINAGAAPVAPTVSGGSGN